MNFSFLPALYCLVLAAEVFAALTAGSGLEYFFKPLLMPVLLVYFLSGLSRRGANAFPVAAALFFSWLGDLFLLFDKTRPGFFIYGLAAFLAAHVFYILHFWRMRKLNRVEDAPGISVFAAVAAYGLVFFAFLAPAAGALLVPIAVYSLVLMTMLAASLAAFDLKEDDFGKLCVAGALLFVLSDSLLAVNRFITPFRYAPALVMLTYGAAQLLIAAGSRRNLLEKEKRQPE
jgi:uncharacterized membrane protein YhhN